MRLREFTNTDGVDVYINPEFVKTVRVDSDGDTVIEFYDSSFEYVTNPLEFVLGELQS